MPDNYWSTCFLLPHPLMPFFDGLHLAICSLDYLVSFPTVQIHSAIPIKLLLYKYLSLFWLILKVNDKVISEPALECILVSSWTLNGPHRCGYSRQSRAIAGKQ